MSTTTMHFGPEWMRAKPQPSPKIHPPPSPPATNASASSYSALVSPAVPVQADQRDDSHPFRYSKDDLLRIYQEGGGKTGLGLEVERWEGVVREDGAVPIALCEMSEAEKKAFAGPLNSEIRRRQSTDFLPTISTQGLDRPRLATSNSVAASSPHRERFGALMSRRRDSSDAFPATTPRKLSLTGTQAPILSPRDASLQSPRTRMPYSPNFDGVLNGGGSWLSRRRGEATDAGPPPRDSDPDNDKAQAIAEEDESSPPAPKDPSSAPARANGVNTGTGSLADNVAQMNLGNSLSGRNGNASAGPPPGLDLTTVQWSYIDPQQNVQGPFQASVMQKWFEGGYFTDDLLMKRTNYDMDWISVEDLKRRAAGDKIFMSHINPPAPPPGISRHDSPMAVPDSTSFSNSPFQPAPVRQLRTGTLDSYIGSGSTPSDSPSSSLGARFGNGSPDPAAFGGRAGLAGDASIGSSRLASFAMGPEQAYSGRRNTFDADAGMGMRGPGYGGAANMLARGSMDAHAFNGGVSGPWPSSAGAMATGFDARQDPGYGAYGAGGQAMNGFGVMRSASQDAGMGGIGPGYGNLEYGGLRDVNSASGLAMAHGGHHQFTPSPTMAYAQASGSVGGFSQSGLPLNQQGQLASGSATSSPWLRHAAPSEIRRTDSASSSNMASPAVAGQAPWGVASVTSSQNERGGWYAASRGVVEENWGGSGDGNGLTNFNIDQHNRQQQQPTTEPSASAAATAPLSAPVATEAELEPQQQQQPSVDTVEEPARVAPAATPAKKGKRKEVTQKLNLSSPALKPAASADSDIARDPTPPQSAQPKPAWLKEDDKRKSGVTLSLREIQDMEARQAEARKAAEKAARIPTASTPGAQAALVTEDAAGFTASWGLPTSQAGGRGSVTPKESPAATAPGGAPVWTTGGGSHPAAKKTMKEILEEEERRKKTAAKETVAAAAARRAYADTTQKNTPPPQQSAWTTVGASGKTTAPVTPSRPAPTQTPSTSAPSVTAKVNGAPAVKPPAPAPSKPAPVVRDTTPSSEFLKWLYDTLSRGLNATVNAEEIMTMLTTFPVEDISTPSTLELIQEIIYAHSTTMDGRRFASDFATRRKADVASRAAGSSASKPVSIADVVKAQPKPTQPEWGGFKVVNKKKKGGRS
ncbi:hypothetical protein BD626DRAFT_499090 [Schizophyllum amplum]|uniref:GYF domain-containing protein n=1 Tax=Schizophyllum amplum TaxID=97359 RepID=A0A550CC65_9AGAR|nr:hypothetical protein BD626DRAFT_499090 [Auriculariopsis ampla]